MKIRVFSFLSLVLLLFCMQGFSQSSSDKAPAQSGPTPLHLFASNKGVLIQSIIERRFSSGSKFSFSGLAEYYGSYKNNPEENEYMIQTFFNMDLIGNFSLMAGSLLNDANGFGPTMGLQYTLAAKHLFLIALPRVEYLKHYNFEFFTLVEFAPPITKKWSIYSQLENVYNRDLTHNLHEIHYSRWRLGLSRGGYQFGLGANFSTYGPEKIQNNQYGIFLRKEFF